MDDPTDDAYSELLASDLKDIPLTNLALWGHKRVEKFFQEQQAVLESFGFLNAASNESLVELGKWFAVPEFQRYAFCNDRSQTERCEELKRAVERKTEEGIASRLQKEHRLSRSAERAKMRCGVWTPYAYDDQEQQRVFIFHDAINHMDEWSTRYFKCVLSTACQKEALALKMCRSGLCGEASEKVWNCVLRNGLDIELDDTRRKVMQKFAMKHV